MTWNYRVVRRIVGGEVTFGIHEVYYDGDRPKTTTECPIDPYGETLEELKDDLDRMREALDKPVLNYEVF